MHHRLDVVPYGECAVLARVPPGGPAPHLLADAVRALPGVQDAVPAEQTVLVRFDARATTADQVTRALHAARPNTAEPEDPAADLVLDVAYTGEDLAEAAALAGLSTDQLIAAHTATTWTVLFCGFAPGFGYLRPTHADAQLNLPNLDVPRRDTARTRVPAGSVALAAGYTGVYPRSSPGGWQLIGRTDAPLWELHRDPPALLRPGVRVRFRAVTG